MPQDKIKNCKFVSKVRSLCIILDNFLQDLFFYLYLNLSINLCGDFPHDIYFFLFGL